MKKHEELKYVATLHFLEDAKTEEEYWAQYDAMQKALIQVLRNHGYNCVAPQRRNKNNSTNTFEDPTTSSEAQQRRKEARSWPPVM